MSDASAAQLCVPAHKVMVVASEGNEKTAKMLRNTIKGNSILEVSLPVSGGRMRSVLRVLWGYLATLGLLWGYSGGAMGYFGLLSGLLWGYLGATLKAFLKQSRDMMGVFPCLR